MILLSIKQLNKEVYSKEAILIGILWNKPEIFDMYDDEKLNRKTLGNANWGFFLGLGRHLHKKGMNVFDEISVYSAISELKLNDKFEKYGGFQVIEELMEEAKPSVDNFEAYYSDVKKYALLREYYKLFGEKVTTDVDNYKYRELSGNEISMYWNDKLNNIDIANNETKIVAYNLLADLKKFVEELDINPDLGMPFYRGKKLTEIINGWALGTLSIIGAFSGNGKTSLIIHSIFMGCIEAKEKLLVIANEMDLTQYRKLMLITIMGTEMYSRYKDYFEKPRFNRKNINKGNFTPEEKQKLMMAIEWIESTVEDNGLIKFIPLEEYTMDNVEKVVRKYARRGYSRVVIDTAKPSEGGNKERWQQFVEDFDRLYKLARKDGGGLNLAIFCTVQQADHYVGRYYLNEQCIADGKKIKNVADLVWHIRPVFPTELNGGDKELKVYTWKPKEEGDIFNEDEDVPQRIVDEDNENEEDNDESNNSFQTSDGVTMVKHRVILKQGKIYYILFTSKNRRGQSNLTGLPYLIFEVDMNSNRWKEIGIANNVFRDDL